MTDKMTLEEALANLDHGDDAHWNKTDGLPDLNVLTEYTGRRVKRSEVNELAPDFKRNESAPEEPEAEPEEEEAAEEPEAPSEPEKEPETKEKTMWIVASPIKENGKNLKVGSEYKGEYVEQLREAGAIRQAE